MDSNLTLLRKIYDRTTRGLHQGQYPCQQAVRQLEGLELDRTFVDHASGKDTKRPQLEQMLNFVRSGDTVVVHSMDRLARNLDDLRRIVQTLTQKGVCIEFVKELSCYSSSLAQPNSSHKRRGISWSILSRT